MIAAAALLLAGCTRVWVTKYSYRGHNFAIVTTEQTGYDVEDEYRVYRQEDDGTWKASPENWYEIKTKGRDLGRIESNELGSGGKKTGVGTGRAEGLRRLATAFKRAGQEARCLRRSAARRPLRRASPSP
jgi:hypothetical protein